jgi:hypothetical protein
VSHSLHTDPYVVRAARRVVAPYRRRANEPRVARRRARLERTLGAVTDAAADNACGPPARADVRVGPPRPGFVHPAGTGDITRLLAFFGPPATYGPSCAGNRPLRSGCNALDALFERAIRSTAV